MFPLLKSRYKSTRPTWKSNSISRATLTDTQLFTLEFHVHHPTDLQVVPVPSSCVLAFRISANRLPASIYIDIYAPHALSARSYAEEALCSRREGGPHFSATLPELEEKRVCPCPLWNETQSLNSLANHALTMVYKKHRENGTVL